jgi:hypothetical protein
MITIASRLVNSRNSHIVESGSLGIQGAAAKPGELAIAVCRSSYPRRQAVNLTTNLTTNSVKTGEKRPKKGEGRRNLIRSRRALLCACLHRFSRVLAATPKKRISCMACKRSAVRPRYPPHCKLASRKRLRDFFTHFSEVRTGWSTTNFVLSDFQSDLLAAPMEPVNTALFPLATRLIRRPLVCYARGHFGGWRF